MAHEHIDYAGKPQAKGPRRHLDGSGKEIIPASEQPQVVPAKGSLLKWGWKPSSLQAATAAKVKAAELAAKQKALAAVGKVPLAPARYPGQPITAANQKILQDRILAQNPVAATALPPGATPANTGLGVDVKWLLQQQYNQQNKQRLLFPKQTAVNQLNLQQQQSSDAVLNMFKQRAAQPKVGTSAPLVSGWMGI